MARSIILLVALIATSAFVLLNWPAFASTSELNLCFALVQAPLGMIMLALVALLCVGFVVWALSMQATVLFESRRQARELQTQRDLADKAEASRFTELRSYIGAELARMGQANEETRVRIANRLDLLEHKQRLTLEQTANTLAASLGQMEDRLERAGHISVEDERRGLGLPHA